MRTMATKHAPQRRTRFFRVTVAIPAVSGGKVASMPRGAYRFTGRTTMCGDAALRFRDSRGREFRVLQDQWTIWIALDAVRVGR